jgi:sterol desaturase/sphingolipid hydroxylase (fatty acid hydroxylase superfamily)
MNYSGIELLHRIAASGGGLRLGVFIAVLALMLWLESRWPRRDAPLRRSRWPANFGLGAVNALLLRLLPLLAVGVAMQAQLAGWGLFNQLHLPPVIAVLMAWLLLDCAIYWQHRALHTPLLWRLHRPHHADTAFDASTALRFHPLEILLSMLYKMGVVLALGAPVAAVILFEIALNAAALFNHANFDLPGDRWLRRILVTPDFHRVHHSSHRHEIDSNYGNVLSVWDYLFGSYVAQPRDGHASMQIGLAEFRDDSQQKIVPLLLQPFRP